VAIFSDHPIRTLADLRQFEAAMSLDKRLPEHSVLVQCSILFGT